MPMDINVSSNISNVVDHGLNALIDPVKITDDFLDESDWRVHENSNQQKNIGSLILHQSSTVTAAYWLNKVYTGDIATAHKSCDIHIHDLGMYSVYCCGWSIRQLLEEGLGGVKSQVNSAPAKHLISAMQQIVNFLGILQNEAAGAQAFSSFDTYLAPFVKKDSMTDKEIKQSAQQFLFGINTPSRWGCVELDTEVLTPQGWKNSETLKEGDDIYNWVNGKLVIGKVNKVIIKDYQGELYNFKNKYYSYEQPVTDYHNVLTTGYSSHSQEKLIQAKDITKYHNLPIQIDAQLPDNENISDIEIEIAAKMYCDGFFNWGYSKYDENKKDFVHLPYEATYYQVPKNIFCSIKENPKIISKLFSSYGLEYSRITQKAGFKIMGKLFCKDITVWRFHNNNAEKLAKLLGRGNKIDDKFLTMGSRQAKLFIHTWAKSDNSNKLRLKYRYNEIASSLQHIALLAGYTSFDKKGKPGTTDYIELRQRKALNYKSLEKTPYNGKVWCPSTTGNTAIFRTRDKCVFISGQSQAPFSNITLDFIPPKDLLDENPIIGGKKMNFTYRDCQDEMNRFNRMLFEVFKEGDSVGNLFQYPVITVNCVDGFFENIDPQVEQLLYEITAKYGTPYFSNFIGNTSMKIEDARSMCPVHKNEKVLIKSSRYSTFEYSYIGNIAHNVQKGKSSENTYEIYSNGKFVKGRFNKLDQQNIYEIELETGQKLKTGEHHLNLVQINKQPKTLSTLDLSIIKNDIYFPFSLNKYEGEGGTYDLGYFVGCYAGDGSHDRYFTVVFSLNKNKKYPVALKLAEIAKKYFGANSSMTTNNDENLLTLKVYSKAALGLCNDFVEGKERNKCYKPRLYETSIDFRNGVIQGHIDTDGDERKRISTSSWRMVETLNMLAATLGTFTKINTDTRLGRLSKKPVYQVRLFSLANQQYGNTWYKDEEDNKVWVRMKSIQKCNKEQVFCFEVENNEPVFTLGSSGILTHNCRLRLDLREIHKRGGGLFGSAEKTGSIGVVTINLPKIGYLSHNEDELFERLSYTMDIARKSLFIKRKKLEKNLENGLYPYIQRYLGNLDNHFSTIGIVGMNELLLNFKPIAQDIGTPEGQDFAIKILNFMRNRIADYQEEDETILYNLESTPAESTCYRLALHDKKKYSDIITAGTLSAPYYTNSSNLPVGYTDDPWIAIRKQENLQKIYSGGTVFHVFLGERIDDWQRVKDFVKKICYGSELPYITISPTFSHCPIHGYLPGDTKGVCPYCKSEAIEEYKKAKAKLEMKKAEIMGAGKETEEYCT